MAVIQLKRRVPGTGKPASGTAANEVRIGELATSISALGAGGIAELYIGDGTYVHDLVSAARQVELTGNQSIAGDKTFTGHIIGAPSVLQLSGGTNGQVLSTNGSSVLSWMTLPEGLVTTFSATETYTAGEFVIHGGHMYRSNTAVTAGAFDPTEWDQIADMSDLEDYLPLVGGTLSGNLQFSHTNAQIIAANGLGLNTTAGTINLTAGANGNVTATTSGTGSITLTSAATGAINLSAQHVVLLNDPVAAMEAATRQYVDAQIGVSSAVGPFSATETYTAGAFVIHNGHLYRASAANGPGAFDGDDWDRIVDVSDLEDYLPLAGGTLTGFLTLHADPTANLHTATKQYVDVRTPTQPFSATAAYAVGNFVYQGGHLYRANAANGPGAFTATQWDQVATVADFDGELLSDLEIKAPLEGDGLTAGTALGVTMATTGQVDAGSDAVHPISSAALRSQIIGGVNGVASLATTSKLVVPAINELHTAVTAVTGALRFVGNYNATTSQVTTAATGTLTVNANLPAAAQVNEGWYVIVVADGTPTAPAPTVAMEIGDWIVSTGTQWIHVPLYHAATTATNVGITTIDAQTWTHVQGALEGLYNRSTTAGNTAVLADHTSILGDGTSITPLTASVGELRIGTVDGGTF